MLPSDCNDNVIKAGDYVIVRSYDDKSSYIVLCDGERKINKSRISMKEIVGHHYDQIFELNNRKFHAVSVAEQIATEYYDPDGSITAFDIRSTANTTTIHSDDVNNGIDYIENHDVKLELHDTDLAAGVNEPTAKPYINNTSLRGNNSYYTDTNTAQKLSNEDIKRLKEQGLSGKAIIQNLIDHSDTFASKNEYAQEKWLRKKDNKYRRKYKVSEMVMLRW